MLILCYIWTHGWTCMTIRHAEAALYPAPADPPRSVMRAGYWPTRKLGGRARYPVGFT